MGQPRHVCAPMVWHGPYLVLMDCDFAWLELCSDALVLTSKSDSRFGIPSSLSGYLFASMGFT